MKCFRNLLVKHGFKQYFFAISKIKHSNHNYRYLVQRLMNKTSWSSVDDIDQFFKPISGFRIRIVIIEPWLFPDSLFFAERQLHTLRCNFAFLPLPYNTDIFKAIILSNNQITAEVSMNCH